MFISLNSLGSMVLDVNGNRLDAAFIDQAGVKRDYFTILKGAAASTAPSAPTNLHATLTAATRIDLAWTDTAGDESGFEVQRSTDNVSFTTIVTRGANVTSYSDTGLKRNRTYYLPGARLQDRHADALLRYSATIAVKTSK